MGDREIEWVRAAMHARTVRATGRLDHGTTSQLRTLEADGRGVVLRTYPSDGVVRDPTAIVRSEGRALHAARQILGPLVPEPLAWDVDGSGTGGVALLMTMLPGTPVVQGVDPHQVARPLAAVHAGVVPRGLPEYRPWVDPQNVSVPEWTTAPEAWSWMARMLHERAAPVSPPVFLHRDVHPGNLLWRHGALTGIVDWAFACRGPRGADVAHMRSNLALLDGPKAAGDFLEAYRVLVPGYRHDVWWDGADLVSFGDDFTGVLALNALGASLSVEAVHARADHYMAALAASAASAASATG